jgi:menaquinol-cytochrome c reductase iron-sulfur subunit
MNTEPTTSPSPTRRAFHQRIIYGLTSLIGAALGVPALAYLFVPSRRAEDTTWSEAGDLNALPLGEPSEVVIYRKRIDSWKITMERTTAWIVRQDDEHALAFAPHCTHLGCGYHWDSEKAKFACPCHQSFFSLDGEVLSGPAPRPLDRFETRLVGRRLWLGAVRTSQPEELL